ARNLLPETTRYLMAAWEYQHRPAEQARLTLTEFAGRRGLYLYALRQWTDYLGLGDYPLMTIPVRDVLGNPGVHVWKGPADGPSLTVNTNNRELQILSFRLPPRSVAVHPGPSNGVVVGWKSPISGRVRVTGRLADADPQGGDGVAWILDHRTGAGVRELAG